MQLRARDLCSGYGRLEVLHDIDFELGDGELVAVLGPNGAGKTTLMKTLSRVLPVTGGTLELDGESMLRWTAIEAARSGIGFVPQEHNVFADLTVAENLEIGASLNAAGKDAIEDVLRRFPILAERRIQRAGSLSGGERQMLAISSALVTQPRLLLLDEPTAGLAPIIVERLSASIHEIAETGVSVVWVVEQDPQAVLQYADRAYVLAGGQVQHTGAAADLADEDLIDMFVAGTLH